MSGPRSAGTTRALAVASWALAVVLAGSVIWWGVAAIGGEAGAARAGVLSEADVAALAAQAAPSGTGSTPSATANPSPTQVTPSAEPSTGAPGPTTTPPTTQPPGAAGVARTWDVPGGQVGASCRGAAINLSYATPLDGWTVEVEHAGPEEVEVKFRRAEARTSVKAECKGGVPEQQTEVEEN